MAYTKQKNDSWSGIDFVINRCFFITMIRYLHRSCPRCNGYVGIIVREPGRNTSLQAVDGSCLRCGFRMAWIVIRGRKLSLAVKTHRKLPPRAENNFWHYRHGLSEISSIIFLIVSSRRANTIVLVDRRCAMAATRHYDEDLRSIGQALEAREISDFELKRLPEMPISNQGRSSWLSCTKGQLP